MTLQVASFANQQNAQHALAMLQGAAIGRAQLFDTDVNGKKVWRLRIGPVDVATAPELAAWASGNRSACATEAWLSAARHGVRPAIAA